MNVYEIIKKKRDGLELSGEEIKFLVDGFVKGRIPDYQMAAFLMAVYYRSMNARECCDLTRAMAQSGETVDLSEIDGFNIDKHSTGGVGDTTTLVLAPLVAASGGIVAKMSGRELGHIPAARWINWNPFPGCRLNSRRINLSILSTTFM
jgi:pyrimidine-nucleoside phosphorylase